MVVGTTGLVCVTVNLVLQRSTTTPTKISRNPPGHTSFAPPVTKETCLLTTKIAYLMYKGTVNEKKDEYLGK